MVTSKFMRLFTLLIFLSLVVLFIGCGSGGGGGEDKLTSESTLTVDSTVPVDKATEVDTSVPISVKFSEDIEPSTMTTSTFILIVDGSELVPGIVTCSGDTATFTPTSPLSDGKTYTAKVTIGVRNHAGNALKTDIMWDFTIKASSENLNPDVFTPVGSISGIVFDINTQIPIGGAVVLVTYAGKTHKVTTNANGAYSFNNVPAGSGSTGGKYNVTCELTNVPGNGCVVIKSVDVYYANLGEGSNSGLNNDVDEGGSGSSTPVNHLAATLDFKIDPFTCRAL